MKKRLVFASAFTLLLLSCTSLFAPQKKEVISLSSIKLEGYQTNIRDVMEIDGYYKNVSESNVQNIMFFDDGTYAEFFFKNDVPEDKKSSNMQQNVISWIEDDQVRWGINWGVYKIEGDTLIVYSYDKGCFWKAWSISEMRYKIKSRRDLFEFYFSVLTDSYEGKQIDYQYAFVSADSLPLSECWLKENKWIWRNESDWISYMRMIESKKIKKR